MGADGRGCLVHSLGASGSGTSTLGKALEESFGFVHLDTDDYFWLPTDPPFEQRRPIEERQAMLRADALREGNRALTGSLCGWGDFLIPAFTLAVYVDTPKELRIVRLKRRERGRYGARIDPGGDMFENHREFIDWAASYDAGGPDMRRRAMHMRWIEKLPCPVLTVNGARDVSRIAAQVMDALAAADWGERA